MTLTIRRVLGVSAVSNVHPRVLGQAPLLDSPVLGIHVTESADLTGLLEGGELILSSGLSLTTSLEATSAFLNGLAEAGAAGVVFSFLSDAPEIKKCLELAASMAPLPVVLLDDRARFIDITETVHGLIYSAARGLSGVDAVSSLLSSAAAAHLDLREVISSIAEMLDAPLVLEESHSGAVIHQGLDLLQMTHYSRTPAPPEALGTGGRVLGEANWLTYPVIAHGRKLGQLVTPVGAGNLRASLAMEQVATFLGGMLRNGPADLALARQESLAMIVRNVRSGENRNENELILQAAVLGVEAIDLFIPIAINIKHQDGFTQSQGSPDPDAIAASLQHTLADGRYRAFACGLGKNGVGIMLCLLPAAEIEAAVSDVHERVVSTLGAHGNALAWTMGVGTGSSKWGTAALKGLDDACRVAHSASSMDHSEASYHRASDLGFRWLMQQLLDVEESHTFVRDQLAPFLAEPEYLDFIETYLQTNGSIAELSRALHLSRPSVYARLRRIEKVLGRELTDADTMTSLHLAVTLYRLGVKD